MPVTPLHLGPALVFKAAAGVYMSLTVFAFSQVLMDVEVLIRIAVGSTRLHGFTNTILGASVVLVPAAFVGRPVCQFCLRWWNAHLSDELRPWLTFPENISWPAAWSGAALGVYSHWLLDAMMHADALPLAPFSTANPFLSWMSISGLHMLCLGSLGIGAALLLVIVVRTARGRR